MSFNEIFEDVVQNSSRLIIFDFYVCIYSIFDIKFLTTFSSDFHFLLYFNVSIVQVQRKLLLSSKTQRIGILPINELQRKNSHSYQIRSMYSFKGFRYDCSYSLQENSFSCPVSGRPTAILLSSQYYTRLSIHLVLSGNIIDTSDLVGWNVQSIRTGFVCHFVDKSDIGESSPDHDLVVSSSRSVRVEIDWFDSSLLQILRGRRLKSDFPSRRNVVRCDGVSQVQ